MLYVGTIFLGYKKFKITTVLSTAHKFNWFLCESCNPCYPHNYRKFTPNSSTTYRKATCSINPYCDSLPQKECIDDNICKFTFQLPEYGTSLGGILSMDKLTLLQYKSRVAMDDFVFGCIHEAHGHYPHRITGFLGLANSLHSILTQLKETIFLYCLPTGAKSGWVQFGPAVNASGPTVANTPLVNPESGLYYVNILSFTLENGTRIIINQPHDKFLVHTGSAKSFVDPVTLGRLIESLKAVVPYPPSMRILDPSLASIPGYDLCFKVDKRDTKNPKFTWMRVEFRTGGSIYLGWNNLFWKVSDRIWCFTFRSSDMIGVGGSVLGSEAQMGREIVVKPDDGEISFKFLGGC